MTDLLERTPPPIEATPDKGEAFSSSDYELSLAALSHDVTTTDDVSTSSEDEVSSPSAYEQSLAALSHDVIGEEDVKTDINQLNDEVVVGYLVEHGLKDTELNYYSRQIQLVHSFMVNGDPRSLDIAQREYEKLQEFIDQDVESGNITPDQRSAIKELVTAAIGDEANLQHDEPKSVEEFTDVMQLPGGANAMDQLEFNNQTETIEDIQNKGTILLKEAFATKNSKDARKAMNTVKATLMKKAGATDGEWNADYTNLLQQFANKYSDEIGKKGTKWLVEAVNEVPVYEVENLQMPGGATAIDIDDVKVMQESDIYQALNTVKKRIKSIWSKAMKNLLETDDSSSDIDLKEAYKKTSEKVKRKILAGVVGGAAVGLTIANYKSGILGARPEEVVKVTK